MEKKIYSLVGDEKFCKYILYRNTNSLMIKNTLHIRIFIFTHTRDSRIGEKNWKMTKVLTVIRFCHFFSFLLSCFT